LEARTFEAEFRLRLGDSRGWNLLRPLFDSDELREVVDAIRVLQGLERWNDVERETGAALARFPDERDLRFSRAAALERLERHDESESLFVELVDEDPQDAAAANYLGYSWADRGRNLDEALELISRAVALEPENAAYLDSLGWVHFRLGDLERAEFWLRRAVEFTNQDGTVLSHLGEVLLIRGKETEARTMLRNALFLGCEHTDHVQALLDGIDDGD
jgi:Flp pilus assembly protein TadD